jgi:DNA-binding MarR family transcriptional regulator
MSTPNSSRDPFSDDELAAWHGLLAVYSRVMRELDPALLREHGISVREFDVLITLFNASNYSFRMSELAQHVMLSPSGLTRLVERLERSRLVQRRNDINDARSFLAVLTDAGLQRLDEARTTHNAIIRAQFLDRLTADDMKSVGALWNRALLNEG